MKGFILMQYSIFRDHCDVPYNQVCTYELPNAMCKETLVTSDLALAKIIQANCTKLVAHMSSIINSAPCTRSTFYFKRGAMGILWLLGMDCTRSYTSFRTLIEHRVPKHHPHETIFLLHFITC